MITLKFVALNVSYSAININDRYIEEENEFCRDLIKAIPDFPLNKWIDFSCGIRVWNPNQQNTPTTSVGTGLGYGYIKATTREI